MLEAVMELELLNTLPMRKKLSPALVKRVNGDAPLMPEEFGEVGFTSKDREALIRLTYVVGDMEKKLDRYEIRFERIERERVTTEEAKRLATEMSKDLNELKVETAKMETRLVQANADLTSKCESQQTGLEAIKRQMVRYVSYVAGGLFVAGLVSKVFFHI